MDERTKAEILRELTAINKFVDFALNTIEEADPTILGSKGADLIRSGVNERVLFIVSHIEEDSTRTDCQPTTT